MPSIMDRDLDPRELTSRKRRRIVAVAIAIAAIAFSFAATVQWLRPSVRRTDVQLARVERGSIDATVQASGTLTPAAEQVISSPVEARVLRILRHPGDRVKAGDALIELDTAASRLDVERINGSIAGKESEAAQLRLTLEDHLANVRADLEQKKLDADIFRYKAEQNARLHREGLVSAQDDLAAATAAKKSDIELAQLRDALVRAQRSGEAQLASIASQLDTLRKERDESQRQLTLAMMRADRDGVVTAMVDDAGTTLRRGDVVARIADLSAYRVDASISDLHASEIAAGMPVRVRVDEATTLRGQVSSIEPRIENGIMKFHVALNEPGEAKLRNNLRVDVFVVTGHRDGVLRVQRGALGTADREDVYVLRGSNLVRTPVRWGLAGEQYIEPLDALHDGDQIAISNMNDYQGVKELRLR